jgi:hypothetical protein
MHYETVLIFFFVREVSTARSSLFYYFWVYVVASPYIDHVILGIIFINK